MALSKKSVTNLLKDTLVKFYTDIFKPDLDNHTHNYAGSSTAGGSATSAEKVNHQLNIVFKAIQGGARTAYDGSSSQTVLISPANIGAAYEDHTHNYAAALAPGGAATSANKVNNSLTLQLNGTTSKTFDGSSAQTFNVTPAGIGAAATNHTHSGYAPASHTHPYAGSSTAGGVATQAAKTTGTLTIQTNGTSAGTFNGSANKTINITPANIGAAAANHSHNDYASNGVVFTIQNNVETLQRDVNNLKTQVGNIDTILDEINGVSL